METYTKEEKKDDNNEPVDEKGYEKDSRVSFWCNQLQAATEASKQWWGQTSEAYSEYLAGQKKRPTGDELRVGGVDWDSSRTRYPLWWSSMRTVEPALYSRTPVPVAKKNFDDMRDDVGRLGTLCLERLANYLMLKVPFDRVQYYTRDLYLEGNKTTNRIRFDVKIKMKMEKQYYQQVQSVDPATQQPMMMLIDQQGQPLADTSNIQQDETGFYTEIEVEDLESYRVVLEPLHYRDVLHTPNARWQEEIDWMAYKAFMTKDEVRDRFGAEKANELNYNKTERDQRLDNAVSEDVAIPIKYAEIWEIWDKKKKKVYWYCDECTDYFLDEKDDPYELVDFFPSPAFMLGNTGADDLFPTPDYIQLRPIINQLHGMFMRYRVLIRALRRRGLFDAGIPELQQLAEFGDEAEFIGVKNFASVVGDVGIDNIVKFFPVGEISTAVVQIAQLIQDFEAKFYELYGIPDILRGVSDPRETASAQQMKGRYLSLRFSSVQRDFQRLIRDDIELMCDLALKKFPIEKLAEIMGFEHMKPVDKQLFPQVLEMLQNDTERTLRVDIETDSTISMNETEQIVQRNYLAETLFKGLNAISGLSKENPMFLPVVAQTVLYVVRGLRNGQEIEQALEETLAILQQQQQNPQQQEQQPDPQIIKAQLQAQTQQAKIQADTQLGQANLVMQQQELQLKAQQMQVMLQKLMIDSQTEQQKMMLQKEVNDLEAFISTSKLALEKEYVDLDLQERYMTEERLQKEYELQEAQLLVDAMKPKEPEQAKQAQAPAPSVNVINVPGGGSIL